MFYQHFQGLSDPFDTFVGDKMSILVDRICFQHFQYYISHLYHPMKKLKYWSLFPF
jgi:hypothetical protein